MTTPTASLVYIHSSVTDEFYYLIPVSSTVMATPTASLVYVSSSVTEELYYLIPMSSTAMVTPTASLVYVCSFEHLSALYCHDDTDYCTQRFDQRS